MDVFYDDRVWISTTNETQTPEYFEAKNLRNLLTQNQTKGTKAIVAVPVDADLNFKQAMVDIIKHVMEGLEEVELVPEPLAAAAYYLCSNYSSKECPFDFITIFDWG